MRMIDKDALEEAVQGAINIMESKGISMISASVPLAIIKGAPTIDAIPVKWLNERRRKACGEADTGIMDAITVLCNEYHLCNLWHKE